MFPANRLRVHSRRRIKAHRTCMVTAFVLSSLFLVSYLLHHVQVGSVPFQHEGWILGVYFAVLVPHVVLAAGDRSARAVHDLSWLDGAYREASTDRSLDVAALALRFGQRRRRLPDAVSSMSSGVGCSSRSAAGPWIAPKRKPCSF